MKRPCRRLSPRAPGETVAPYRHRRDRPTLTKLAGWLNTWLTKHLKQLERAEPIMPLEDRAADTWEPLIAVADLADDQWPARARAAAVALTTAREETAVGSDRIRLLTDCRTAFGDADALPTAAIIDRLKVDPEAPWADLTPMRLAASLREYDIRSDTIRFPVPIGQAKGYRPDAFTDAWDRYCPHHGDTTTGGEPYQPYQPSLPSPTPVRPETRYGSSRTSQDPVPGLTSADTTGTAGTATPAPPGHLRLVKRS